MSNPLNLPSPNDILELVKKESIIRLSPEYIKACDDVCNEVNGWLRVTSEMQESLVKNAGFIGIGSEIAINMLRRAQYDHPDNEDVQNLVYVKNNKANIGKFRTGDFAENVMLYKKDAKSKIQLFDIINNDKINIIFAASHT